MKFVKRITALFLAMVMVMAMGINVCAAGNATTGWEIKTKTDDTHTYKVWQIMTGSLGDDGALGQIVAGSNYKTSKGDAAAAAESIAALTGSDQEKANAIADYVDFTTDAYATVTASSPKTGVPSGYYLIEDKGDLNNGATTDSYSTYIVKVVNDVEITPKKDTPKFEKKIQDINDSTDTTYGNLQDSADYDIGDEVPFTLTATLPSNYTDYTQYYIQFKDQMEGGLTFTKTSVVVKVGDSVLDSSKYTIDDTSAWVTGGSVNETNSNQAKASGFTITINDLKTAAPAATNGTKITVTYTAKLNENAVLGNTGNVNEAKLIYSNNPNWDGEGDSPKGETPWDHVIVFTYKVDVNKVQPDEASTKPLAGAAFKLEKQMKDGTWTTVKEYTVDEQNPATSFEFKGLDDGTYKLTETTTPAGFNTISPITFTITASHNATWEDAQRTTILTDLSGADSNTGDGKITFTVEESKAGLSTDVVNQKGSNLPSTGGMGTTVLYVAGIALIVVAGVVVIARKRNA